MRCSCSYGRGIPRIIMKKLTFATTIKALRIRYNMSLSRLSDLTGISTDDLSKIEEGARIRLSSYQLGELADAFFCNRQYLLDLYGWKKGDDTISDYLSYLDNQKLWTDISDAALSCLQDLMPVMAAG